MHVLILGLSSIAKRRILPALQAMDDVHQVDVATRQAAVGGLKDPWPHGEVFDSYREAIDASRADVVYVSLPNSEHAQWTARAIRRGAHVVVDKPAFLAARDADRLVALAEKQGVCLAEATVYGYHPQIQTARDLLFCDGKSSIRRITASFSFPPLPADNFRYVRALGGGALWDLGPYAVSAGRIFFGDRPVAVACQILSWGGEDHVETAFSLLTTFPDGRALVGHFGWDTVYRNRLELLGESVAVEIDRVFTTPPDAAGQMRVTRPDGTVPIDGRIGDTFALFLRHVFDSIERRSWSGLYADLLADAHALEQLREAAGVTSSAD